MAFGMDEGFSVLFQTKSLEAGYEICSYSIVSIVHVNIELPEQYYIRRQRAEQSRWWLIKLKIWVWTDEKEISLNLQGVDKIIGIL